MTNTYKYWKGEEELERSESFIAANKNEFAEALPLEEVLNEDGFELNSNRRDFLKYFGFSVTAVALAACYRTPVRKAVPYLVKPESVTPGVADYYSSTCGACSVGCGVEVKVREGRPIKLEGSPRSIISNPTKTTTGGLCAIGQASILSLYDNERLAQPLMNGSPMEDWAKLDVEITGKLNKLAADKKRIVILSNSIHSPSTLSAIESFKKKFSAEHVMFDAISYSGMLEANLADFGKAVLPTYHFNKADVIVSFGADFLGTWLSPVEFTKGYSSRRIPSKDNVMSVHIQFESNLSMTGSNADHRFPMKTGKEALYLASLYNAIANATGGKSVSIAQTGELAGGAIAQAAKLLVAAKGKSLVISGSNNQNNQKLVNGINAMLGNLGSTIDFTNHSNQFKGIDSAEETLAKDLAAGKVAAIIFYGTNPVYQSNTELWKKAIEKAEVKISFAITNDETAKLCTYVLPDHHYLESWGDAEPKAGMYQFFQPTISPVFNTRQAQVTLLTWSEALPKVEKDPFSQKGILNQKLSASPYYNYIKANWAEKLGADAESGFNKCLHDGAIGEMKESASPSYSGNVNELASWVSSNSKDNALELILFTNVGVGNGDHANNPWTQELPDPVSKVTWDNYVALPKALAVKNNIKNGNTVNLKINGKAYENIPALIQPGQANGTISLALGYGRTAAGKVAGNTDKGIDALGINAYPFVGLADGTRNYVVTSVELSKGDDNYELAQTQTHHSIEGRDHVREGSYADWQKNPKAGNEKAKPHVYTIWEKRDYLKDGQPNHLWGMAIDLNACTGCSACVVACSIENNVPVVGRDEIRLRREMHWIRIDRYYAFTNTNKEFNSKYVTREKEIAALDKADGGAYTHWENVQVVNQPMMCQHCSQAPCESVCPVLATTHSSEGLNQMTYNRCIGTKYCGNNCPYKVRRFNWFRYNENDKFDFHFNNPLGRMVINPDVTVRTRGVMEKCSFCVQKIQEGKLKAKRENRTVTDGEVKTACQRSCPANAIVFGDRHDPNSEISKLYGNERNFKVLEELNVQSNVTYLTKIRNTQNS